MEKKGSLFIGLFLVLLGILSLGGNLLFSLGKNLPTSIFQMWPVIIIGIGLLFVMPPFFFPRNRGLAGLFFPGLPILVTGGILFTASMLRNWHIWAYAWPLEVLAVALSFLMAAIFMRVIWLLIPAFIIGFIAAALQFCAITGWWASWAVLWTVIPLGLGLAFIIIGLKERRNTLTIVGAGLCGFAGLAFAGVSFSSLTWRFVNLLAPLFVIGMGALIVALGFIRPANKPTQVETGEPVAESSAQ